MFVTVPPELLEALHGKLVPSAARGLLLGLPYGGGVAMTICDSAVAVRAAMAEATRMLLMEDMFGLDGLYDFR